MAYAWQTVEKAAVTLGISTRTIARRIAKGELDSRLSNGRREVYICLPASGVVDTAEDTVETVEGELTGNDTTTEEREAEYEETVRHTVAASSAPGGGCGDEHGVDPCGRPRPPRGVGDQCHSTINGHRPRRSAYGSATSAVGVECSGSDGGVRGGGDRLDRQQRDQRPDDRRQHARKSRGGGQAGGRAGTRQAIAWR